ncbi:PP2C family protein-serine/threonine phosphatase [Streptomyces sp. NPDC097619]|uniref:PP2C family protein-serine/threonine phosphatase n=1 Tax=Streptomyces sp. NPDC097619 TaxID=3157228 RepID=UPI003325C996
MSASPGTPAHPRSAADHVGATWGNAPYPVLVVDRHGSLVQVNEAARLVLPDAVAGGRLDEAAPAWLAEAHRSLSGRSRRAAPGPAVGADPPAAADPEPAGRDAREHVPQPRAVRSRGPAVAHAPPTPAPARPGASVPAPRRPLSGRIEDRVFEAHPTPSPDGGDVVWWLVDHTDRSAAEAALDSARTRSEILSGASSTLLSTLNVPRCMEIAASLAASHLADAAVLVAPSQGRHHPLTYARRGTTAHQALLRVDPRSVPGLAEALQGFPPVPTRWIDPATVPDWVVPDGLATPVGSVIVVPLPGYGMPAGALILLRSATERAFSAEEEVFARLFAARAGAALAAARLYTEQASITSVLMRELLPPDLHAVHGIEYAGGYRASTDHERVGGDFYDVHPGPHPAAESLVVLGDVSGKGLDAAVLTGKIRNTLQALLPLADDHQRVLDLLNGALLSSHHTRFATLVLASVRRRAGRAHLRLTSAGHLAPLIVRADGTVETVPTRGTLVGALPAVPARTVERVLAPGDLCLLYTDGITEARGGPLGDELFGEERLARALTECAGMPAEAVVERVRMLASQWLGTGRHDDMAVVAIGAPRTGPLSVVGGGAGSEERTKNG